MGKGLAGFLDPIFGSVDEAKESGAFPGLGELGTEYQQFLLERLTTPVTETEQYGVGVGAIRDALTMGSATARQRLGDRAVTGSFMDSGAVQSGLTAIDRGEAQALAQQISALTLGLMDRQEQGVMSFLSQGAGEFQQVQGTNIQAQMGQRQMGMDFATSLVSPFAKAKAADLFASDAPFEY